MTRPALTPAQVVAVTLPPADACVTAGAGSGKTTVLVERFVHLVAEHGADPRRIAALTFTEKAADEMRARIGAAFSDPDRPESVRERAREVEFAPISTIHSFCARLLRDHAIEAGLDPAFTLLDATAATLLLEDASREVERRMRAAPAAAPRGAAGGDSGAVALWLLGDERMGTSVRALFDAVRSKGADPAAVGWTRGPLDRAGALDALAAARARLEEAAAPVPWRPDDERAFREACARLPVPAALASAGFDAARAAAAAGGAKGAAKGLPVQAGPKFKAVREARDALADAYEAVADALLDDLGEREVAPALRGLLARIGEEYARRKDEAGALDFADLEQKALALLHGLRGRGRTPEGAPEHLLVDEYQDTNPVQVAILDLLRAPAGAAPVPRFAVGDAKQSIYRFRGADVRGMVRAREEAPPAARASLLESFRSRGELVAFHNALFPPLFAASAPPESAGPGIACEPMEARARFAAGPEVPVEVLVVDVDGDAERRRLAEARAIARRIRAWVGDGTPGSGALRTKLPRGAPRPAGDPPAPGRPLGFGDVAVLLRARTDMKVYERALTEEGIPFHVVRGRGFYAAEEVADLLNLLRVVHDPRDGFAVAAWAAGPAVGARDDEVLAAFAGGARSARGGEAFAALRRMPRFAGAVASIDRLRRLSETDSLASVVAAAIEASAAVPTALMQDGGARRARNLAKALAIARRLDGEGEHGLADYLRRLTDLRDREVEESEATSGAPERESVALGTVHAAKGLEWPCVVVADVGRQGGGRTPAFRVSEDGASCAWRLRDPVEGESVPSGGYRALCAQDARRDEEESTRLFYVAATRAEERLLLSFSACGLTKEGLPKHAHGWAEALWPRLAVPFADGVHETRLGDAPVTVTLEASGCPATSCCARGAGSGSFARGAGSGGTNAAGGADRDPAGARAPWIRRFGPEGVTAGAAPDGGAAARTRARARWAAVREPRAGLARTPFVVTISDLLAYAASPAACYRDRVLGPDPSHATAPSREAGDPAAFVGTDAEEGGLPPREGHLDEGRETIDGLDRAALGRAVHAALERFDGRTPLPALVDAAVEAEWGPSAPARARAAALAMVERFAGSATGREVAAALARGDGVRREVAFHARVAFPDREPVAGLDSLLLKGTIDLWLPRGDGVAILDHKTNSPRGTHRSVADLVGHYEPQLRLYALAAERITGRAPTAAGLLLLDPEWGRRGEPVEAAVDVSGDSLLEARRLCRAYAISCWTDRWPATWREALNFVPPAKGRDRLAVS